MEVLLLAKLKSWLEGAQAGDFDCGKFLASGSDVKLSCGESFIACFEPRTWYVRNGVGFFNSSFGKLKKHKIVGQVGRK